MSKAQESIKVVPCGTKAKFGAIEGTIASIEVSFTNVTYKFGYFDRDHNYKTLWCHFDELKISPHEKQTIGFLPVNR